MKHLMSGAVLACVMAGQSFAEGYSVYDLGWVSDRSTCMMRGENAVRRYMALNGGSGVDLGDWVIYGWDFEPGDQDLTLLCPYVNDTMNAFLIVHGEASENERIFTADTIERYFKSPK